MTTDDPLSPEYLSKQPTPKDAPNPEVRSAMARDALKNTSFGAKLIEKRRKKHSELVHEFLELKTKDVLTQYINQIREAKRNGFPCSPQVMEQISEKLYNDIQMAFGPCGREDLHIMLSTVLLGVWMEALDKIN